MLDSNDIAAYLKNSPTSYHAAEAAELLAREGGAIGLDPGESWNLERGGLYFLRNQGMLTLFRVGQGDPVETGFSLAAAHTDSPGLKLKWGAGTFKEPYFRVPVELYGGPIISSWMDRELSCAGLVSGIDKNGGFCSRLLQSSGPVGIIPNLAIHLNREVNKGYHYNEQEELQVLFPGIESWEALLKACDYSDAWKSLQGDLFLFDPAPPALLGDYLISGRIDNLASCYAGLSALLEAPPGDVTSLLFLADGEEIGSRMEAGADSALLSGILRRIFSLIYGADRGEGNYSCLEEPFQRALSRSFLISADGAHAVHPNFRSKHDGDFSPLPGKGPVIKKSASFRYTTRADGAVRVSALAEKAGVPLQTLIGRSDMKSGSTVGPLLSSNIPVAAVDMGVPMLSMHSIRESCMSSDLLHLSRILKEHFMTPPHLAPSHSTMSTREER